MRPFAATPTFKERAREKEVRKSWTEILNNMNKKSDGDEGGDEEEELPVRQHICLMFI